MKKYFSNGLDTVANHHLERIGDVGVLHERIATCDMHAHRG